MQRTLHPHGLAASSRPNNGFASGLLVLFAWLGAFGVGLRLLVGWPVLPSVPQQLPSWTAAQVWLQSPGAPLQELVSIAALLAWVVWFWALAGVLLRIGVDFADALTRGARWVGTLRLA